MALQWNQINEHSWVGHGGKYEYHIHQLENKSYGIARGKDSKEWFQFTLTLKYAQEVAEEDVIKNILKEEYQC